MELQTKTATLPSGNTYSYYRKAAVTGQPTLLFLHGFPSGRQDWRQQTSHFSSSDYGLLVPDLLGYGESSKPNEYTAYHWRSMCADMAALLDYEGVNKVIGVGHDLGSWMLSRLVHYHPSRISGAAYLDVGYSPPGDRFDVDMINRMTKQVAGEEKFCYWDFFCSSDGVAIMDACPESMLTLMHAADPAVSASNMGPPGKARAWVKDGRTAETGIWMQGEDLREAVERFQSGGHAGPLNWYKALRENVSFEDEQTMSKELHVPVLVIGAGRDQMTAADFQRQMTEPHALAGFRFETLDAGHWVMLERAQEVNELLEEFANTIWSESVFKSA